MPGITGLGTNYNLPNYSGELFQLTPSDTPFLSAIGGLTGGGMTTSTEFEWQTYDLRAAGQNVKVEGANAPTAESRVRANVTNVVQIHQEAIDLAYSKLAATGQKAGTNNEATNPVRSEMDWQIEQYLKQIARDAEFSFINGIYQKPSDNATPRRTRGLLAAITSNRIQARVSTGTGATATAATNLIGLTAHGLTAGTAIRITAVTNGAPLAVGQVYFVRDVTANSFGLALTRGGAQVDITADGTGVGFDVLAPVTTALVDDLMQSVWSNGGLQESTTATLLCSGHVKRAVSKAYADAYGKFNETSRTVGGVAVETIVTDFGVLNVMVNRYVPADTLIVASLEQCTPVFLEVPDKGTLFVEPLAKTGASDRVQLYGELGLAYGNEAAHGVITGLGL